MKLTLLTHTDGAATSEVIDGIARAAVQKGHEVTVFAMADGVKRLGDPTLSALADAGVTVTVCEHNVRERGAATGVASVTYGSQFDLAGYVADGDRLVSFIQ